MRSYNFYTHGKRGNARKFDEDVECADIGCARKHALDLATIWSSDVKFFESECENEAEYVYYE